MKLFFVTALILICYSSVNAQTVEREADLNFDWKFTLVEETTLPDQLPLDDGDWRDVRLPHDWSVEFPFSEELEGCTGYLPGGVGIYQKHFKTPASTTEKSTYVKFDGVYNNATFWLNGKLLGENPYGYSPVNWDLTPFLKTDGTDNILTVHVDHSRYADSRWYTGSGIYRNVKLVTVNKLHIPIWGTFLTTPEVSEELAKVQLKIKVENQSVASSFILNTKLVDKSGNIVSEKNDELKLKGKSADEFTQTFAIEHPKLWDCENPNMYKAITSIIKNEEVVDQYITPFGVRSLVFDKDQGFFLNGKQTFVKGVCLHHDGGLVGAAVPKGVWERRLALLKEAGCNAIRTSHNPFSEEFLDLCDEMGFLVQNEIFDEMDNPKDKQHNLNERSVKYITRGYTEHFQEWGESDLKRTILRDRNHPSVFQWSIGNEIEWTYEHYKHVSGLWDPGAGNYWNAIPKLTAKEMQDRYNSLPDRKYKLAETAKRLAGWVKEVDTTRPVTANLIIPVASCASGYAAALDVVGFSYQIAQYDWCKKNYPDMMFTGNENSGLLEEWNSIIENPMVFSMYMWTGIDYLGESHGRWPGRRPWGDMLDLAGFKVQGWNYFKSIWTNEPHISIGTLPVEGSGFEIDELSGKAIPESKNSYKWRDSNMHWNYKEGDTILVEVCSNYSTVELLLNGKSLGFRGMSEAPDRLLRWVVPFEEGTLTARTEFDGKVVVTELKTSSKTDAITVSVDKNSLKADAYDVAHVVVQLVDMDGRPVKTENTNVEFSIEGPAKLLGVDCGNHNKHQTFQSNKIETYKGRCLAIIQSMKGGGIVTVTAKANGLESQSVVIEIKQ